MIWKHTDAAHPHRALRERLPVHFSLSGPQRLPIREGCGIPPLELLSMRS
jgi:hypothetical protein